MTCYPHDFALKWPKYIYIYIYIYLYDIENYQKVANRICLFSIFYVNVLWPMTVYNVAIMLPSWLCLEMENKKNDMIAGIIKE